ncbi:hypothetical protein RclHR1_00050008 [Rhizophagus clarus]|uniref:Protein kinase domain-containing protein n=1 Tax=Rhizophagus clarus TaxID=94130 RepID=A0A2Z6S1V6_9GLOM|nr:hypothetical protein RclHR1_00050008 [Rhizophagus clarus]
MSTQTDKDSSDNIIGLEQSAENGDKKAQYNLAHLYYTGEAVEKDLNKAFYWYQKAAENGIKFAMNRLAIHYYNGEGTEKDLEKAFYWCQKAAEKDYDEAQYNLALLYENGEGTEKDIAEALYWYQKAAENGIEIAMNSLANHYYNGEGTEKDIDKAFYWYQKAAENGIEIAMNNLAIQYYNGEGAEKDLEKAFYWCQKAAEKDYNKAQYNLALLYENGEGTGKNLEKAFYWCQKAAETGNKVAMNSLAIYYYNGEGTEIDLEKAFYWYGKAAENGNESAMNNLANRYYNGEGTEKNLEKALYWYQKAAEKDCNEARYNLALLYENENGIENNLEKAFYWRQKVTENSKIISETFKINKLCNECKQMCSDYQWCQQCNIKRFQQNFSGWTSENQFIDEFIQEAQLNAKNNYEILEWIPYSKLKNITYYDKGGFSKIYKAFWLDGPIDSWNFDKLQWNRWNSQRGYIGYEVILKDLNNSSCLDNKFLNEWKHHYNCQKKSFSKFIQIFGITRNPENSNYIIVMSYAKEGSLRKCLPKIVKFKWQEKLKLLKKIILGLKVIHESCLAHCDLHDGNILISDNFNESFIIDLGLCRPISNLQDSDNKDKIYGVLPFMAPEVLRSKPYTSASDIYSFSMIMWEFTSGIPPFNKKAHDLQLSLSICKGERPEIMKNTPNCYIDLMKKCWDTDPENRPTVTELEYKISEWIKIINDEYEVRNIDKKLKNVMNEIVEADKALEEKQTNISITSITYPSSCYYTSRLLTEILSQNSECSGCTIKDYYFGQ